MIINRYIAYLLGATTVVAMLFGAGYYQGNKHATEKYLPQVVDLKTRINVADEQAKATVIKQKENENAIANEINDSVGRINDYYRLLARGYKASSCTTAGSTESPDGATSEPAAVEQSLEFEEACTRDANSLAMWQEWATKNQIPISE